MGRVNRAKKPEDVQLEFFPAAVLDILGSLQDDALAFIPHGGRPLLRVRVEPAPGGFSWCASVHGRYRRLMPRGSLCSTDPMPTAGQAFTAAADHLRGLLAKVPAEDRSAVKTWLGSVYAHANQFR